MRPLVGVLLATVLGFASCGNGSVEVAEAGAVPSEPATVRAESTRWDRAIIVAGGTSLTVEFVGGGKGPLTERCNADYEAEVDETTDEIVITVYRRQVAEPPEEEVIACPAVGYLWAIEVPITEQVGGRAVIDGHDASVHVPISESELPSPQAATTTTSAELVTTTTAASTEVRELDDQGRLAAWVDSARFEPWYDGFQFEPTDEGLYGVVALNLDADPPELPADLPLRSVVSRMGQQRWRDLVPSLADEMETMGIVGLSYDPFSDNLTVSRRRDVPAGANDTKVAERVRTLLGDSFDDVAIIFDTGTGTDFESPPTTR